MRSIGSCMNSKRSTTSRCHKAKWTRHTVQYYALPVDYWDKYPDHIGAIDAAAAQASAKKFVDLDHLQWICVGDRKEIESVLKKYGTVNVVDVTGKAEN